MNYSAIDSILDDFERAFKDIKVKHKLTQATIERWRWDLPKISLMWLQDDAIWRTINVLIDPSQNASDCLIDRVEVNAWQDTQIDNRWIRRWQYEVICEAIPCTTPKLLPYGDPLTKGYATVSGWSSIDLKS